MPLQAPAAPKQPQFNAQSQPGSQPGSQPQFSAQQPQYNAQPAAGSSQQGLTQAMIAAANQPGYLGIRANAVNNQILQQQQQAAPQQQGGGVNFNIGTGIRSGPIWGQGQMQQADQRLQQPAAPPVNMPNRPMSSGMNQHLASITGPQNQQQATDFARQGAYANAQMQALSDRARIEAEQRWAQMAAQQYAMQLAMQGQNENSILGVLGALMG